MTDTLTNPRATPSNDGGHRDLSSTDAIRLVAERELRTRVTSKAFLGGLAFTVVLVVLGFVFGAAVGGEDPTRIGVVGDGTSGVWRSYLSPAPDGLAVWTNHLRLALGVKPGTGSQVYHAEQ